MPATDRSRPRRTKGDAEPDGSAFPGHSLAAQLGYCFTRPQLLTQALTHGSFFYEQELRGSSGLNFAHDQTHGDNERLEFLGDAVLGMIVADAVYAQFPDSGEGTLTQMRSNLVSRKHLGAVGTALKLGTHLQLGRGEERSGGRTRPALLANTLEALIGAMYLDGGMAPVRAFVDRAIIGGRLRRFARTLQSGGTLGDAKSALQELLQARGLAPAAYSVAKETGPDHDKRFHIQVAAQTDGKPLRARAEARSKKKAEQQAAAKLLRKLSPAPSAGKEALLGP